MGVGLRARDSAYAMQSSGVTLLFAKRRGRARPPEDLSAKQPM